MANKSTNVRNSGWNLANILLYPAAFLAATPFFIDRLGENVFGEWMLLNSYVFIAVHLVGFGLPVSITAHVAEAIGQGDDKKLHAYINASTRLLGRMTALTVLFALLLIAAGAVGINFFEKNTWKAIVVATFFIATKFPEILYQNIFKGQESYDKAAVFNMLNRFIALFAQVILVMKGYSLTAIMLSNLVVGTLVLIPQAWIIYRKLPGYRPFIMKSLPEKKELYHFGFWTWLQTIIAIISYQLDRFVVAYFLGTATVTYYVLASTIVNHLHMAFEAVTSWLLPKVSRLKAAMQDTLGYFVTIRAFSVGFSLLIIVGLYQVSGPLFTLWLGPEKYGKMVLFFKLFLVFEAFLILSIVPKYYLNALKSLFFITWIELMYKSAIIAGMLIAFILAGTAESLIYGQTAALVFMMPLEYFLVNKRIKVGNHFKETLLTSLPSLFVLGVVLFNMWILKATSMALAIGFFWMVYIRDKRFDRKLLNE